MNFKKKVTFQVDDSLSDSDDNSASNTGEESDNSLVKESPLQTKKKTFEYIIPRREVYTVSDMTIWLKSEAYYLMTAFIEDVNEAISGTPNHVIVIEGSPAIGGVLEILNTLDMWAKDELKNSDPPKISFRRWFKIVDKNVANLIGKALGGKYPVAAGELQAYFMESFGNPRSLLFGIRNETAFCIFLIGLIRIGALRTFDRIAIGTRIYARYLQVVKNLIKVFKFGSDYKECRVNGFYSREDFFILPFIWGSSQLATQPWVRPNVIINNEDFQRSYCRESLFLTAVVDINERRGEPLNEEEDGDAFWNISLVQSWQLVNERLLDVFHDEVLGKFSVVRYFKFGKLFPISSRTTIKRIGTVFTVSRERNEKLSIPEDTQDVCPEEHTGQN